MTDALLSSRLLAFLSAHKGRANAITRDEVLFAMQAWWPELTDRALRDAYSVLPICSTASKPYGLYLPATPAELDAFIAEYAAHVGPIRAAERRKVFYRDRPDLRPDAETKQGNLFGGEA